STESSSSSEEESTESTESSSSSEEESEVDTILDTEEEGFDTVFVVPADVNPFDECDPFLQDCPEGDKCSPFASQGGPWDANKCVPILGDQAPGEPCQLDSIESGLDDCDGSGYCFTDVCAAFCQGSEIDPICPPGFECQIANEGSITLCIATCDPLAQDCAEGQGCFFDGNTFLCAPTTENVPIGEPCGFINDCAAGSICVFGDALPACAGEACCSGVLRHPRARRMNVRSCRGPAACRLATVSSRSGCALSPDRALQ
ncbi:MAG: hypothetical protein HC927_13365, partial [Deltaproteobacteria bacterium]|nr:hypothetical protein [Deltaproteobacteria bacterium]